MDFLLKINREALEGFDCDVVGDGGGRRRKSIFTKLEGQGNVLIGIGDIIQPRDYKKEDGILHKLLVDFSYQEVLKLGGFFYLFHYSKQNKELVITSSFGGILPVYYCEFGTHLIVSSDINVISKSVSAKLSLNKKYLIERLLFNYSLTDSTLYSEVRRLPANTSLKISEKRVFEEKYFEFFGLFNFKPIHYKQKMDDLVDFFIEDTKRFIPFNNSAYLSFTSGFDGRTLLSLSQYYGYNPMTFSFGVKKSLDIILPQKQSEVLGIDYKPILLNEEDYLSKSFFYGKNIVKHSKGEANFARAHYNYAAETLSEDGEFLISGNFGSELFRAFHNIGVMCSKWLYLLFVESKEGLREKLSKAPELSMLSNICDIDLCIEEIITDTEKRDWFVNKELSLNQRFYLFVFEEMFRKYFGPEIVMQNKYLVCRTPFWNLSFIKKLLETNLGGVHNEFFTNNPFLRIKGQRFYGEVIRRTSPELSKMITGKGYNPFSLTTSYGAINIALSKSIGKFKANKKDVRDPFAVSSSFQKNRSLWTKELKKSMLFSGVKFSEVNEGIPKNTIYTILSLAYYLNHF